ncbi:MAG: 6,7-dimethyl-8-ribityllumazine synthase [Candidatus Omnitrophica bacterium]|nr:6,7-dimethyl-8-ribityllumazine synthase [Candidatus Omnitrophota bacterium]
MNAKQPVRVALRGKVWRQAASRKRVIVVASQFNPSVTRALADGAVAALTEQGVPRDHIRVCWVPGAFELPLAVASAATEAKPDAIVALGCLIRGQTPQYAAIGQAVAAGLQQVSLEAGVPVGFGLIIAESMAQARERSGGRAGHRGREAALAALAMTEFRRNFASRNF